MIQTTYCPDKFGTYLSYPESLDSGIDLKWELCTSHTGRRTFISYNVMRCPTEAEVRKCSGHKSAKTFERYITFDED